MPDLQAIRRPLQLLVEGKDAVNAFGAMQRRSRLPAVDIRNFGGVNGFPDSTSLRALAQSPGFGGATCLGVVRDAEDQPVADAARSVCGALKRAGLPFPDVPGRWKDGVHEGRAFRTGVFLLPDNRNPGMLETLLLRTLEGTAVKRCIAEFFACAEVPEGQLRHDKRRAIAYLSTRDRPHQSVGVAAWQGAWDLNHPALQPLRRFLTDMGHAP